MIQEGDNVEEFAEFGRQTGGPYPLTYDHVILCLGVQHDMQFYDESTSKFTTKLPLLVMCGSVLNDRMRGASSADDAAEQEVPSYDA